MSARLVRTHQLGSAAGLLGSVALIAGAGVAIPYWPQLAAGPVVLLLGLLVALRPEARVCVLVFGGLATLGSSQALTSIKIVYLVAAAVAFVAALTRLRSEGTSAARQQASPLIRMSFAVLLLAVLSGVVAVSGGTSISAWLRDVSPYLLLGAAPIVALDAFECLSARVTQALFLAAGGLAAVSVGVAWLGRRGFTGLAFDRIVLPSGALAIALFCFAFSKALRGRRDRVVWSGISGLLIGTLLLSASRSIVTVAAAPLGMFFVRGGRGIATALRLVATIAASAVVAVVTLQFGAALTGSDVSRLQGRLTAIPLSTAQLGLDQSAKERLAQGRVAWHEFKAAPFAGVGPGHGFQWRDNVGLVREGFNIDTPLGFVAKFGLLGIGTLFFVAVQLFAFIRSLRGNGAAAKIAKSALVGYVAFAAAWSLLGAPFEDKGFSFGLLFLLLIALRSHAGETSSPSGGQLERP